MDISDTFDHLTDPDEPRYDPLITDQVSLLRAWRFLLHPLGFSRPSLWLMLIGGDDRPLPVLTEIDECDGPPERFAVDALARMLRDLAADHGPGARWAMLRARPGRGPVTAEDRAWAATLVAACRRAGVPSEVVHLATDERIVPLPADDLPSGGLLAAS